MPAASTSSSGAVADDVGLGDEADPGDHDHVGEAERQPELLGSVRGAAEAADLVAEVGDRVEHPVGGGDEEDADHGEAEREQAQAQDDEAFGSLPPHSGGHSNWLGSQWGRAGASLKAWDEGRWSGLSSPRSPWSCLSSPRPPARPPTPTGLPDDLGRQGRPPDQRHDRHRRAVRVLRKQRDPHRRGPARQGQAREGRDPVRRGIPRAARRNASAATASTPKCSPTTCPLGRWCASRPARARSPRPSRSLDSRA